MTSSALGLQTVPHYTTFEPESQKQLYRFIRAANIESSRGGPEPIPIFVITCDRITALIKALLSYYQIFKHPIAVVIHDNNTTYPPLLEFLARLESEGVAVYHSRNTAYDAASLGTVRDTVSDWFQNNNSSHYIVTDPDIEFQAGAEDMLDAHKFLLDTYVHIDVAGPMLRRDDIPDHYPLKALVHEQQGHLHFPETQWLTPWNDKTLTVQSGWIDTTFGMYRKGFRFRNLNRAIQTHAPYVARHSDWYLDPSNMAPDQIFYRQKNNPVGHWGSTFLPDEMPKNRHAGKDMTLLSSYRIVRRPQKIASV